MIWRCRHCGAGYQLRETAAVCCKSWDRTRQPEVNMSTTIYSAGYRSSQDVLAWLVDQAVAAVVDVRFSPWYGAKWAGDQVKERLELLGIGYIWLRGAGNPFYKMRPLEASLARYAKYLDTTTIEHQVATIATHQRTALLCACVKRSRCHRGVILSRLEARGFEACDLEDSKPQRSLFDWSAA
jgi:hypothetical protein